ncbi:hypothetical protein C8J57DRAFT_1227089 [Mycena rebaudengoi]|nr:hypothetical protein C8J57DRAFT_1227089 [Mycena rebaudengoi]
MDPSGSNKAFKSTSSSKKWGLQIQTVQRPPARRNSDWLGASLITARTISAAAESFPYLKGVFGTVVILLETVETVKKNREDLKGLCGNVMEIITIVRDQTSLHGDTAAVKFKSICEDLEECLHGVLNTVGELERKPEGLHGRFKEIIRGRKTADEIAGYEKKIRELRSNVVEEREKTQIGLKFIENSFSQCFVGSFSDTFLIDSSTTQTIETGLKNIAVTNHVGSTPRDALMWLSGEPTGWLLFFDNADDPQIDLNKYFPQCNHGNILITSRNPGLCVYAGSHCLVSDMEETEAVELLLKSSAQEMTQKNKEISAEIVKALWYFPLAIIQAGAFIAKSGALSSYLSLYTRNRARLLSEKPAQSHDEYSWTVYTTWQMSFERLSQAAATLLQLWSLLHHQGISEDIFHNASKYTSTGAACPSQEELKRPFNFLSQFLGQSGLWEPLHFMDVTNELRAYSLVEFDLETNMFAVHPLVHSWLRSTLSEAEADHHCMVAIVGMCIAIMQNAERDAAALWLVPHVESLLQGRIDTAPDFNMEYGGIYSRAGKFKKAEELQVWTIEKRKKILGEDHPEIPRLMERLAITYHRLGQFGKAEEIELAVLEKEKTVFGMAHSNTLDTMGRKFESSVLEERRKSLGEDNPLTLISMGNLGWILHNLRRLREAENLQATVATKQKKLLGKEHLHTLWTMGNLGSTYRALGKLNQAEELESFVFAKQRKILGENHPYSLWTMANLALTYREQGHFEKAREIQVTVLEKKKRTLGNEHPETIRATEELDSTCATLAQLNQIQNSQAVGEEKIVQ